MIKRIVMVGAVLMLAACGGGGGSSTLSTPAQKTSIVDGGWTSGGTTAPHTTLAATTGIYSDTLGIYDRVTFSNGQINTSGYVSIGQTLTTYSNGGSFTVSGNTLTYTLTWKSQSSNAIGASINDILNNPSNILTINETHAVIVSVDGNSMIWKDSSGNTVATFSK